MKIYLKNVAEDESYTFDEEIPPQDLDLDMGVMHFPEAIHVQGDAWKSGDDLTINAHVKTGRQFVCSRCLVDFNNVFEKDLTLHYDIKGQDAVELDADIRDEMLLEHPIKVLCRPDCLGLCITCGANLNQGKCSCKKSDPIRIE